MTNRDMSSEVFLLVSVTQQNAITHLHLPTVPVSVTKAISIREATD
jgi:hypothetical protein